jgi:hypothetical protein
MPPCCRVGGRFGREWAPGVQAGELSGPVSPVQSLPRSPPGEPRRAQDGFPSFAELQAFAAAAASGGSEPPSRRHSGVGERRPPPGHYSGVSPVRGAPAAQADDRDAAPAPANVCDCGRSASDLLGAVLEVHPVALRCVALIGGLHAVARPTCGGRSRPCRRTLHSTRTTATTACPPTQRSTRREVRPARRCATPGPEQPAALRHRCGSPSCLAAVCAALAGLRSDLGV